MKIIVLVHLTLLVRSTIQAETGRCSSEEWEHVPQENKYILAVRDARTYEFHARTCALVGGQLLNIRNEETQNFAMKHMKSKDYCGEVYFGLTGGLGGMGFWSDDSRLTENDYQNWMINDGPGYSDYCATVNSCGKPMGWTRNECNKTLPAICETYLPCHSNPIIYINEGEPLSNGTNVWITHGSPVKIACLLMGNDKDVTEKKLFCEWDKNRAHRDGDLETTISWTNNGKICECQAVHNVGYIERTFFTISVQIRPMIVNDSQRELEISIEKNFNTVLKFSVFANPKPLKYFLVRDERAVNSNAYNFLVSPEKSQSNYHVELNLTTAMLTVGRYRFMIVNKLNESASYNFILMAARKKKMESLESSHKVESSGKTLLILTMGLGVTAVASIIIYHKSRKYETDANSIEDPYYLKRRSTRTSTVAGRRYGNGRESIYQI